MKKILLIIATLSLLTSCAKEETSTCNSGDPKIIGATCNDGTSYSATGSGACSSHGGVATWKCSN